MKTAKNVKLNPISELILDIVNPDKMVVDITAESLKSYNVMETKEGILKVSSELYNSVGVLATLRESKGTSEEDIETLNKASNVVQNCANAWFMMLGSRDPKKAKETKRRPLYSVTKADFVILGELSADARTAVGGDLAKVQESFLKQLVFASARLIEGKPLERVSAAELKAAKTAFNKAKSDKAQQTRRKNEVEQTKADAENAKQKAKIEELEAKVKKYEENAIDVTKVIALINASHATEGEKLEIIQMLTGKNKKSEKSKPNKKSSK